jgi:uncharacterized membrane protein
MATNVQQATLTVWKFPTSSGAEQAVETLERLQQEGLVNLVDGAIVSWPTDKKKPKTEQLKSLTGAGALSGSFWGLLFGLIFFVPILGLAVGAAMGAMAGSLANVGISDDFIKRVRSEVMPGTSALFAYGYAVAPDKVEAAMKPLRPTLLTSNLSREQEEKLRQVFAEDTF